MKTTAGQESRLSRAWDSYAAYLFDIDGTLLNCRDAVHYFAFCDALTTTAGRPVNLDGVVTHGNTDEGILRDAFTLANVDEAMWRARMEAVRQQMGTQVEANRHSFDIEVLPGVEPLLQHLGSRGALLSTATGNLQRVGEAKLSHCDLLRYFALGGWSDGFETRRDVFAGALQAIHAKLGSQATVCVVGDTPADVQAAHALGLEVIAVATGIYSFDALAAEGPELTLLSLKSLLSA